jgi:hypothetical protein
MAPEDDTKRMFTFMFAHPSLWRFLFRFFGSREWRSDIETDSIDIGGRRC